MEFDVNEVKSSDYLKIIGVTIDKKLIFREHISDICKKTRWSAKLLLFILCYCLKKMDKIQERALRVVFKSKTETYSELLTRARLW